MPAKQPQKRSSVKENTKSSQPTRKTSKASCLQFIEARYKKMSDEDFVKAFEEDTQDVMQEFYSQIKRKYIPFFMANIDRDDREELQDQVDCGEVKLIDLLESYPDLINRLPSSILWQLRSDERLSLLINRPEQADLIVPTLKGDDVWAVMLPQYRPEIRRCCLKLCPWETMTPSQIRYMKLKSAQLKKFIEAQKLG